ncbi:Covalently-linked cell wall protein 14 [Lactiplantibacillus plantarum]|nr:Covalently-linked cell wall protein 14 [Lactiplantibacillus plantarum]
MENFCAVMFFISLIAIVYFSIRWIINHFIKNGVNKPYKKYTFISLIAAVLFLTVGNIASPTHRSSADQTSTSSRISSKHKKKNASNESKRKASISKANSIKEKESSESALSSSKKQSEAESSSIAKASSESLVASSSSAKKASETSKTDNASYTQNGGWTTAASGMVFVSDSNKYYTSVKNPGNYQYMTQSAADNSGAKPAPRGNQYARP